MRESAALAPEPRAIPAPAGQLVTADPTSIMAVISRAASDPNTDVDKLERLMGLYERIQANSANQAFADALNQAQSELGPVAADAANPQTKSKYASYSALDKAVRPVYGRHGFSLSFGTADSPISDHVRVTAELSHREGHTRQYHVDMPADGKGARGGDVMTKTHATGAALSYGQRYLLKLIFNIAVGDDRDGNGADPRESAAVATANAGINGCETETDLRAWKAKNDAFLSTLPADQFDAIVRLFNQRLRAVRGRPA